MEGINDLGNGNGWLYATNASDGTISSSIRNDADGARNIKVEGVKAQSTAMGRVATGSITIENVSGTGYISRVQVSGLNQMDPAFPIAFTPASTSSEIATAIVTAVNSFTATTNYTAVAVGGVVTLTNASKSGSSVNGDWVRVSQDDLILLVTGSTLEGSTVDVDGGSSGTDLYDASIGYRFYINADYTSGTSTPSSLVDAIEITNYIIPKSLTSALDHQNISIVSDAVTFERKSSITAISLDTEVSAATDDLKTISTVGFADADRVLFSGVSPLKVVTILSNNGNIKLQGDTSFITGGLENAIELQLLQGIWYEVSRSTQNVGSITDFRAAGYGIFLREGAETQAVISGGAVSWNPGVNGISQTITGGSTLLSSLSYDALAGINGDEFIVKYDASVITNGFSLTIFGLALTDEQALNGGLVIKARYLDATGWYSTIVPNLDNSQANVFQAGSEFIKNGAITSEKLSTEVKTELLTFPVSWDAGRIGDYKIKIPYACRVIEINAYVTGTISNSNVANLDFKDGTLNSMGSGIFVAGSLIGTGMTTITPTSNYEMNENDLLTVTSSKVTAGGNATVSVRVLKS